MTLRQMTLMSTLAFVLGGAMNTPVLAEEDAPREADVVVRISKQLFDDLVEDAIVDETPIDKFALGARSIGTAKSTAQFRIHLKPMDTQARFRIEVTGETETATVAHSRSVQVPVDSQTNFEGHAYVDYDGWVFDVADGDISAESDIWMGEAQTSRRGVVGRVVRRIAARRSQQRRPQALWQLREETKTAVTDRFNESLRELEKELQQATPLEKTVRLLFPQTRDWVFRPSTTPDFLQTVVGPEQSFAPQIPKRGDEPMQAAIELWVRLPVDDPRVKTVATIWNAAQQMLNTFPQDEALPAAGQISAVKAVRVDDWWVFDLHTASTLPKPEVAGR